MSDPVLAQKDPAVILAEVLARYTAATGITLAAADPRRLFLQTIVLELAQQRALIDYSGKQSMLRFVDAGQTIDNATWIKELGALWEISPGGATPSKYVVRFTAAVASILTIGAGKRVSDGTYVWAVAQTATSSGSVAYIDVLCVCQTLGSATNNVVVGAINTLVDPIPNISGVSNPGTVAVGGRDPETTEEFRTSLRSAPEDQSTAGPRGAYEKAALAASPTVADVVALGPDDAGEMSGTAPTPGEIHVVLIQGTRDPNGNLLSVIPDPTTDTLNTVDAALTPEDVRPLGDHVIVKAPQYSDFDLTVTYYIGRSRSASAVEIRSAVEDAFAAYELWQGSVIGRDINPSQLIADIVNAGAKRVVVSSPSFTALNRDVVARLRYSTLNYGGIEDE